MIDNSMVTMGIYNNRPTIDKNENLKSLKKSCDSFESEILKHFLDKSLKKETSLFPKTAGEDIYESMYREQLSQNLSGGFGYSKLLFEYLKNKV